MNRHRGIVLLVLIALTGCQQHAGLDARYALERKLWQAQMHERKINISFLRTSQRDLQLTIRAFQAITSSNPLDDPRASTWDPIVIDEISRIILVSRIALANLYFLDERYYDARVFYTQTLSETGLAFEQKLDLRLSLARSVYLAGEESELESQCAQIFVDIAASDDFWRGNLVLDEVFINIPVVLARLYRDRGDTARYEEFSTAAHEFYRKIESTWPGSETSARAAFARVNLHILRSDWNQAVTGLTRLEQNPGIEQQKESLQLLRGEIIAYALEDPTGGEEIFRPLAAVTVTPETRFAVFAAKFNLGVLALRYGDKEHGAKLLREIERDDDAPPTVVSKAMFARATFLEQEGRWDEAVPILRRITKLYPHTTPATEAPLVITRHYVATGQEQLAVRNLERAREYYVSLIDRNSKFDGDRLAVEDYLIENYLVTGQAERVAELLETESGRWDEISTAGGMFKSALIYSEILDNREEAIRVLKKCIELFPQTRYAKIAERHLESLEKG